MAAPDRKQLVGLLTQDPGTVLEEGAHLVTSSAPGTSVGHVTSSYHSSVLGRSIALALVRRGRERMGETLQASMPDGPIPAKIVTPVFFDPEGKRTNV
jgi:sarcosine oxidase subunit alpha